MKQGLGEITKLKIIKSYERQEVVESHDCLHREQRKSDFKTSLLLLTSFKESLSRL